MFLILSICLLIIFPTQSLQGSKEGLLLWYNILLPSLFPFLVVSGVLIATNSYQVLIKFLSRPIQLIFQTTPNGSFPVIIGFLCGYPLGAKTVADLYSEGKICKKEAQYLLSFCNNSSPIFIISILVKQFFKDLQLLPFTLFILLICPILMSFFTRRKYKFTNSNSPTNCSNNFFIDMPTIDRCIESAVSTIVKIGAYIIMFSVFIAITERISQFNCSAYTYVLSTLELTNGLKILMSLKFFSQQYISSMALVSFGGICAIAQTSSVLSHTDLAIKPYIIQKITTAIMTVIISYIYIIYIY